METKAFENDSHLSTLIITPENLKEHWQGHRALTRKVIDAFPEKDLFEFSIGGMRPFSELAFEMISMAGPGVKGIATGNWVQFDTTGHDAGFAFPKTKEGILALWDATTEEIDKVWSQIPISRFQEVDVAFGQYENPNYATLFYFIDNEIHHRGQGYVYLRALGHTPPPFWER